jgi:hypothetical protein
MISSPLHSSYYKCLRVARAGNGSYLTVQMIKLSRLSNGPWIFEINDENMLRCSGNDKEISSHV